MDLTTKEKKELVDEAVTAMYMANRQESDRIASRIGFLPLEDMIDMSYPELLPLTESLRPMVIPIGYENEAYEPLFSLFTYAQKMINLNVILEDLPHAMLNSPECQHVLNHHYRQVGCTERDMSPVFTITMMYQKMLPTDTKLSDMGDLAAKMIRGYDRGDLDRERYWTITSSHPLYDTIRPTIEQMAVDAVKQDLAKRAVKLIQHNCTTPGQLKKVAPSVAKWDPKLAEILATAQRASPMPGDFAQCGEATLKEFDDGVKCINGHLAMRQLNAQTREDFGKAAPRYVLFPHELDMGHGKVDEPYYLSLCTKDIVKKYF